MKITQTLKELEKLRKHARRIRVGNAQARWFVEIMKAIESLINATIKCVEHVGRSSR